MKKIFQFALMFFVLFSAKAVMGQGYEIKVKILGLKNDTIILGHHFSDKLIPNDTTILDKSGVGTFKSKEKLTGGMYFIFLPNKRYFDFIIGDDQTFYLENDTAEFLKAFKSEGSDENRIFIDYQQYLFNLNKEATDLRTKLADAKTQEDEKAKISEKLQKMNEQVMLKMDNLINENPNLFFPKFLKATREPEVPASVPDNQKYYYYRDHFFENFDIADVRMLRTPIYQSRLDRYIDLIDKQMPDSIIPSVDKIIRKAKPNAEVYRYILIHFFNHYAASQVMGMDAMYVHIAKNYYIPDASWSDSSFIQETKDRVRRREPNLIGKTAQNIKMLYVPYDHLIKSTTDSLALKDYFYGQYVNLQDVKGRITILVFWESDCSHCKVAVPQFNSVYKQLKDKGIQLIAFHMLSGEEGKKKWAEFVKKNELNNWINVWDPSYQSKYKDKFDIESSPVTYVLDEDKKIIAKRIGPDLVEEIVIDILYDDLLKASTVANRIANTKKFIQSFTSKEALELVKKIADRRLSADEKTTIDGFIQPLIDKAPSDNTGPDKQH